jgi:hypothetical protein
MEVASRFVLTGVFAICSTISLHAGNGMQGAGFEEPAASGLSTISELGFLPQWSYFNSKQSLAGAPSGLTNKISKEGKQSLWLACGPEQAGGYFQGYAYRVDEAISAKTEVTFTAWLRLDAEKPLSGDAVARLCIGFLDRDAEDTEIDRVQKDISPAELATGSWTKVKVSGVCKQDADSVVFSVVLANKSENFKGSSGMFYVDEASYVVK